MSLTCLAGLGGLPAVSIPRTTRGGLPAGVCLVAAPGRDRDLLALASRTRRGWLSATVTDDPVVTSLKRLFRSGFTSGP